MKLVILSGGKSSRMGFDKSFLKFKDTNLISYQYNRLKDYFDVYVSAKDDKFDNKFKLILDKSGIYSPLVALYSILNFTQEKTFILPVDTPFVKIQTIKYIIKNSTKPISIAKDIKKSHYLVGVYSNEILDNIYNNIKNNNHRIRDILIDYEEFCFDEKEFINLNTYDDVKNLNV